MKITKITLNIFAILSAALVLNACSMTKPKVQKDCSTVFETLDDKFIEKKAMEMSKTDSGQTAPVECRVLPVQISQDLKCEISGSDKIDNLTEFYNQSAEDRFVFIGPVKKLLSSDMMSFKSLMIFYNMQVDIAKHIDSDLFDSLKEFRYKGLKCEATGKKFTAWIGENRAIASIEVKEEPKVEAATPPAPKAKHHLKIKKRK